MAGACRLSVAGRRRWGFERLLSTQIMGFAFSETAGRFDGVDAEFEAALDLLARMMAVR